MEDLFGIFLVLDQLAEMMERLERAETRSRAVGMDERGLRIARRGKVMIYFHEAWILLTNINVNTVSTFLPVAARLSSQKAGSAL